MRLLFIIGADTHGYRPLEMCEQITRCYKLACNKKGRPAE